MQRLIRLALVCALIACDAGDVSEQASAARQLASYELNASAAGSDCRVLLIETKTGFDDELVESIQYGTGDYAAFGGVERLAHERRFRAVVYRDHDGGLWTYGATTRNEAQSIRSCR